MGDLKKSLGNLRRALDELNEFLEIKVPTKIERAGVILAFEFCFELFWKNFKKVSESEGLQAGSPKAALRAAYQLRLFEDQGAWLQMLEDRNLTVHTYNEKTSLEIYERIRLIYQDAFDAAYLKLQKWKS